MRRLFSPASQPDQIRAEKRARQLSEVREQHRAWIADTAVALPAAPIFRSH